MHGRNSSWWGAPAIYGPTLLLGTLPWTGVLLRPLAAPRRAWARLRGQWRGEDLAVLLTCGSALPPCVFFAARSRLALYLLPLFSLLAPAVARLASDRLLYRRVVVPGLAAWLVLALLPRWLPHVVPQHQDARALAQTIESISGGPLGEVVFIDSNPRYGLAFYLDAEVERVDLAEVFDKWDGSPVESLWEELPLEEGRRLFAARLSQVAVVRDAIEAAGSTTREVAQAEGLSLFWIEPPRDELERLTADRC